MTSEATMTTTASHFVARPIVPTTSRRPAGSPVVRHATAAVVAGLLGAGLIGLTMHDGSEPATPSPAAGPAPSISYLAVR